VTITIPETPDQVVDLLNDTKQVGQLFKDGKFGDAMKAYADKALSADNEDLLKQMREQLQADLGDWLKDHKAEDAVPEGLRAKAVERQLRGSTSAQRSLYSPRAPGAKADGIFADRTEFMQALAMAAGKTRGTPEMSGKLGRLVEIQNSYGSEVPASGGFLIPETLRSQILEVAIEESIVRSRATVIPMSSLRLPIPMIDDTSHVSSILGGVICYWTEEGAALTESQAKFGRVYLDAKKLTGYAAVPNELLDDAPAFSGFFDSSFPRAIAWFEDIAFISGTAPEEPLGFIGCPASVQVAKQSGQSAATILWENIVGMYARMLPTSLSKAVWIASIDTFPELATMALSVGTGGGPVWIGNFAGGTGGADTPPMSILGRPVIFTEKTPQLGTTGDLDFVDLSYYLIGDRQQMQSAVSDQYLFANDKTAYRVIERLDGRPWLQSAITPHNGSGNTLTPFVQLATRS
jgi:HK97 family phage major capsid protein